MKNLNKILDGNTLSGRERAILIIRNNIAKQKTGKEILDEGEIYMIQNFNSLAQKDFRGRLNYEFRNQAIKEFNRYIGGMNNLQELIFQAKVIYLDLQNRINKTGRAISYFLWNKDPKLEYLKETEDENLLGFCIDITGLNYTDLINESSQEDKKIIQELEKENELEIIKDKNENLIITGESIAKLDKDYDFKKNYLKEIGELKNIFSILYFVENRNLKSDYNELLNIINILEKASIVYEIDLDSEIKEFIEEIRDDFNQMNIELLYILKNLSKEERILSIPLEILFEKTLFNEENIEVKQTELYLKYVEKLKDILRL